jgi:hypothetical protein
MPNAANKGCRHSIDEPVGKQLRRETVSIRFLTGFAWRTGLIDIACRAGVLTVTQARDLFC